ncbi:MAG: PQQ-binding-like beta-propeller repeat protein [Christensenella sp.]|nr:PQQ-binding-like beta-propeller repeat protein [Christensenella sp.]
MDNDRFKDYPGSERRSTSQPRSGSGSGGTSSGAGRSPSSSGRGYEDNGTQNSRGSYAGYDRTSSSGTRAGSSGGQYGGYDRQQGTTSRPASSSRSSSGGGEYGHTRSTSSSGSGGSRGYGSSGGSYGGPRKKKKKKKRIRIQPRAFFILSIIIVVIAMIVVGVKALDYSSNPQEAQASKNPGLFAELFKTPTPSPTPTPTPTPTPSPTPPYDIPHAVDSTQPSVYGLTSAVEVDGNRVDSFERAEKIEFLPDEPYSDVTGVVTFRGNNHRDSAVYGTADVSQKRLSKVWEIDTGELPRSDIGGPTEATWTGSGWVGQPLIVKWPDNIKQLMNMYESAKQKEGLVEVILATMDGNVYFLDLETGEQTRDKLNIGMPFKGAGSLDPRGYPILYLGSGDMYTSDEMKSRAMAYSLIDFTRLYEFGKQNDEFALRDWHAYDSAPLVDAETDTLIYPGENGILYTIKLNTVFDEATGQLSMNPSDVVKMRYVGTRSTYPDSTNTASNKYWLGYETSIATLGEFGYLGTNDGFLQCINLNTMSLVWAQDTQDDTNGSPVLETDFANRTAYVYIGSSLHFTADAEMKGSVSFYKVNAITGEVVWKHTENVNTKNHVSGGVQATALLGEKSISDLVIIPFSRTPNENDGVLLALDKATGAVRWTYKMEKYTWSSPIAVYDANGNAYIVVCEGSDTGGKVFLLDGKTGTLLNTFNAEKNIEASPAAYGKMIVFGTRGMKIWGVKIS